MRTVCGALRGAAAFTGLKVDLDDKSLVCACIARTGSAYTSGLVAVLIVAAPGPSPTCITPREDIMVAAIVALGLQQFTTVSLPYAAD